MIIHVTSATLSKWIAFGTCTVRSIQGYNAQATDVYLQLFDVLPESASVLVSNAAIPQGGSWLCNALNGFKFDCGTQGLTLKNLILAMSTTEASLTAVAAAGGLDFTIDVDSPRLVANFPTLTVVGDLTTSVDHLQVWAEASGPLTLVQIDAKAVSGTTHFVAGYAVDIPAATSKVQFSYGISTGQVNEGDYNFVPFERTPDQVLHQGLTLVAQQTTAAQTIPGINMKCRAIYY